MIRNKLPSYRCKCKAQMETQKNRIYQSRGIEKLTRSTTIQMCLVQRIDGRLEQSWPGKTRRKGGEMSISGMSKVDSRDVKSWLRKYKEEVRKSWKPWRGLDEAEDLMRGRWEWILSETKVKRTTNDNLAESTWFQPTTAIPCGWRAQIRCRESRAAQTQ